MGYEGQLVMAIYEYKFKFMLGKQSPPNIKLQQRETEAIHSQ